MVISGLKEGEKTNKLTSMAPERSKPLHNFSMPWLKWGNQRFLRCQKMDSKGEASPFDRRSSASEADSEGGLEFSQREKRPSPVSFRKSVPIGEKSKSKIDKEKDDGIEEVRAKIMVHLRTAADKMKFVIPEEKVEDDETAAVNEARPWNLRTRRAACKAPNQSGGGSKVEERQHNSSPQRTEHPSPKSLRLRGVAAAATHHGVEKNKKKERRKFSTSLTRDEIEEDFLAMTGNRPCRRPKKRLRVVQKQLDTLFPGLWLLEITADSYRVPDELEPKKK